MAVTPVGSLFGSLTFGGIDSATYGIYISGEGVFNAPERAVELVSVPGRNGDIIIDQGHWNNVEVEYPAGTYAENAEDFRANVSAFRNAIASQQGYQRLSDSYHPDEYRMALYAEGLEVEPVRYNTAGEFTLKFNCKPQRFLTVGESKTTLSSGDTVNNPTLFDAHPLLEAYGYGTIDIDGEEIEVDNVPIGDILIQSNLEKMATGSDLHLTTRFDNVLMNAGDDLKLIGCNFAVKFPYTDITSATGSATNGGVVTFIPSASGILVSVGFNTAHYVANTASTLTSTATYTIVHDGGTTSTGTLTINAIYMHPSDHRFRIEGTTSTNGVQSAINISKIVVDSSVSALGNPMYIDLDIGEAYKEQNGELISVNHAVYLPPELPVLEPGGNVITFDNTFTKLDLVPRWWQL